jgi:hypothetical protein
MVLDVRQLKRYHRCSQEILISKKSIGTLLHKAPAAISLTLLNSCSIPSAFHESTFSSKSFALNYAFHVFQDACFEHDKNYGPRFNNATYFWFLKW